LKLYVIIKTDQAGEKCNKCLQFLNYNPLKLHSIFQLP